MGEICNQVKNKNRYGFYKRSEIMTTGTVRGRSKTFI